MASVKGMFEITVPAWFMHIDVKNKHMTRDLFKYSIKIIKLFVGKKS